jgi:carbonic anhydrase
MTSSIIQDTRILGYKRMRLDTVPSMTQAIAFYNALGGKEIEQYRYDPIRGSKFLELDLTKP